MIILCNNKTCKYLSKNLLCGKPEKVVLRRSNSEIEYLNRYNLECVSYEEKEEK